jgi:putative acetyltransferase
MHPDRHFRWAGATDHGLLADIMFDAVRNGESRYREAQRQAWVPEPRSGPEWEARLAGQDVILAEEAGRGVGFMSLAENGYVDFAYIRPEAQHRGLFGEMLARIVERATAKGETRLWVHASLMAEPAFARFGFEVTRREQVALGGETFDRCEMERVLQLSPAAGRAG